GLVLRQSPVLALAISSSSGLNTQIVELRRTPPLRTASDECITISYASTDVRRGAAIYAFHPKYLFSRIMRILSNARFSGSGPGALPTPELRYEPSGRIFLKLKTTSQSW